jgi:hypothetical protein
MKQMIYTLRIEHSLDITSILNKEVQIRQRTMTGEVNTLDG